MTAVGIAGVRLYRIWQERIAIDGLNDIDFRSAAVESLRQFYQALWTRGSPGVQVNLRVLHGPVVREVVVNSIDRTDFMRKRPTV